MGGSIAYVFRDGQRLTAWMLYVINLLDGDLFRAFGVHVIVTSAIRTYAEQERIFRQRYVTAGNVNGRRVYDTRVWNGVRWYRISAAGTVAVPGTSNHEIQGQKAAVDIRDTGSDAGITVASSKRGRWIRQWCRDKALLIASGDGFGEGWHFDVPGIFRVPPHHGAAGSEDDVLNDDDKAWLEDRIARLPWVYRSSENGRLMGDMVRLNFDSTRFGVAGVQTHGLLTAAIMSEIGAQKIFRATHGQPGEVDVAALADAIAEELEPVDAEKLANAILLAAGKKLSSE